MKLIIHTGQGKTGSSSIQASLKMNKDVLNKNKVYYVGLNFEFAPTLTFEWQKPFGWPDLLALSASDFKKQLYDVIYSTLIELEDQGYNTVVWSNESLFVNFEMLRDVLESLKSKYEVETVAFIRRHDKWLKSAYLQWGIKHKSYSGTVKSFKDWSEMKKPIFAADMQAWLDFAGEKCHFFNFDMCKDANQVIFNLLGLEECTSGVRVNETPNPVEVAMYALYNSLFSESVLPHEIGRLLEKHNVNNLEIANVNLKGLFPAPDELNNVLLNSKNDLNSVNSLLEKTGVDKFSIDNANTLPDTPNITSEQMIAVLLHIVNQQEKSIEELNKLVKGKCL
ncbi:hypothetical protein [Pseudoalteromonas lipolytica]